MATENGQQGPVKNRWTRWYMWLAYGSAVLVVVIIIAAVTSSGDNAEVNPEGQAAISESTQESDNRAEDTPLTHDEYCEELKQHLASISQSWSEVTTLYGVFSGGPSASTNDVKGMDKTIFILDEMDRVATDIQNLNSESTDNINSEIGLLANNLMDNTETVRQNIMTVKKYGAQKDAQMGWYLQFILGVVESLVDLNEDYRSDVIDIAKTGYCEGVTVVQ